MEVYSNLIARQKLFFQSGKMRKAAYRIQLLEKLRTVIRHRNTEIQKALRQDFGKCDWYGCMPWHMESGNIFTPEGSHG